MGGEICCGRAIGYSPARYQRCERSFPYWATDMAKLGLAIMRVGPVSLDWLLWEKPEWAGPIVAYTVALPSQLCRDYRATKNFDEINHIC